MLLALALVAHTSFGALPVASAPSAPSAASPTRSAALVRAELAEVRAALDSATLPAAGVFGGTFLGGSLLAIAGIVFASMGSDCSGICISSQGLAGLVMVAGGAVVIIVGLIVAVTMAIINGLRAGDREPLEARMKALKRELTQAEWQERHGRAPGGPAGPAAVVAPVTIPL